MQGNKESVKLTIVDKQSINKQYPRVLIINPYPIGAKCPIGIMLENLFREYPSTAILQYYTHSCEISEKIKFRSEQIILISQFLTSIKHFIKKNMELNKHKKKGNVKEQDLMLRSTGVRSTQLKSWVNLLVPVNIDNKLLKSIREFNPTVIYTQGYSYTMLKYVNKLSKIIACPVIIHTLDDWMSTQYKRGFLSSIPFRAFNALFKSMLNNGRTHLVGSPAMQHFMYKEYHGKYEFVMNCCDYSSYLDKNNSLIMKIVYTGVLMLERYIILDEIAKCINKLNTDAARFEFHIYAPNSQIEAYRDLMQQTIIFHESVNHEKVYSLLTDSDILVHVESFNPNVICFTKYSLSTKIPEYLASGRPLIYFGPMDIGVADFLEKNKIGIFVNNINELKAQLLLLYSDHKYYKKVAFEAYKKGKEYFDATIMQDRLNRCLLDQL